MDAERILVDIMLERMITPAGPLSPTMAAPMAAVPVPAAQSPPALPAKKAPSHARKVWGMLGSVLYYLFLLALLAGVLVYSRGGGNSSFFGYRYYNVLTSSMQSVYPQGSMVFVHLTDPKEIQVGDDITFYRDPTTVITHRVIEIVPDLDGQGTPGFRTKGVDNALADRDVVLGANVVGTVSLSIPALGFLFSYLRERFWLAALLLILLTATVRVFRSLLRREKKHSKSGAGAPFKYRVKTHEKGCY